MTIGEVMRAPAPATAGFRAALLHALAWSLVTAALTRAALLAFASSSPPVVPQVWFDLSAVTIGWGVVGLSVAFTARMPGPDRRNWLGVIGAISIAASGLSQQLMATAMQLAVTPGLALVIASLAGSVSVATLAAPTDVQERGSLRAGQALLAVLAILGATTLLGAAWSPQRDAPGALPLEPPLVFAILLDLALLLAVMLMALIRPRALRAIQGLLWLSVGLRLATLVGLPPGAIARAHDLLEPLRLSLLALVVRRWAAQCPAPAQADDRPRTPAAWLPSLVVWGALVSVITTQHLAPAPVLGLLGLELGRGVLQRISQTRQRQRWWHRLHAERQAHQAAQAASQQQITALARLIHDQAAPLSGIDRLARELERAEIHGLAQRLSDHLDLLRSLARQLRSVLSDRPLLPRPPVVVAVLPIVRAVIDAAAERAQIARVDLFWVMNSAGATVRGDATALRRILDNLVTNALDATSAGGQVAIELWDDRHVPGWLTISVRDTGTRVPNAAYVPEGRADPSTLPGPGMGLGLGIVRELTEHMGGVYGVTSRPGEGSVCWIRLPAADAPQGPPPRGARDANE
ncbi:hypothetical protein A9Q02_20715 [Candidatus Chloroploca asiatica]|uniref:histidine kinase n=2 Tax=Candidatus Chloroploca asiatica TaxID=1506545 RepID=A0A2H3L053_9CHLR|nr:hypothetical protein A9Q02_20715 [Candidatus Chloroploca asiatica]